MVAASNSVRGKRLSPDGARRLLASLVREPLLHFLVLGVLIFSAILGVRAMQRPTVSIDAQDVNQLVQYWQLQADRPPTKAELSAIIQDRIDEELLAREALRLGMDKGDLIIRRRLAQKMAFASEDLGDAQLSDAVLRAEYERTKTSYAVPGKIALRHIYFSGDRGAEAAKAVATHALDLARQGKTDLGGDPFMLPLTYADASPQGLAKDYGPEFEKLASTTPIGKWVGPVESSFGYHILKVEGRADQTIPPFEQVRDEVRENYLAELRRAKNETVLRKLRQKYRVVISGVTP